LQQHGGGTVCDCHNARYSELLREFLQRRIDSADIERTVPESLLRVVRPITTRHQAACRVPDARLRVGLSNVYYYRAAVAHNPPLNHYE
jgi:hypothetical protein